MSKILTAAALSLLLLAACGSREDKAAPNGAVDAAEANAQGHSSPSDSDQPASPVNAGVESVPPPDAVSHPGGYLPPAPGEADPTNSNSPVPDSSPAATEDEYIHNKQASR